MLYSEETFMQYNTIQYFLPNQNRKKLPGVLLKMIKRIMEHVLKKNYSSSNSSESEEFSKSLLICLIIFIFFSMYLHSFKTLEDNGFHPFLKKNELILLINSYDFGFHLRNFFSIIICSFITIRFYFGFQKI